MQSKARLGWIVLTLVVAIVPLAARAGMGCHRSRHCGRCARPFAACGCAQPFCGQCQLAPANCCCPPPVTIVPQTTTIYRQEQFTTLQPVTRTEIRRQAQVVEVPVTVCKQVTVAETRLQKQVVYRDVPVQVVQQVPVIQTRIVPQRVTTFGPLGMNGFDAATLQTHDHSAHEHAHATPAPIISFEPLPAEESMASVQIPQADAPLPLTQDPPTLVETPRAVLADAQPESPAASSTESVWTKVPSKQAQAGSVQLQGYEVEVRAPVARSSSFAVPTAATAWRAQGAFAR